MAYMPSFFAWLFRPAFKDNKVISSFSTFLRLLLSFFDIPWPFSLFFESLLFFSLLFFAVLWASWRSPHRFAALGVSSLSSFCLPSLFLSSLVSYSTFFLVLFFFLVTWHSPHIFRWSLSYFSSLFFSFPSPTLLHLISCSLFLLCSLLLFFFSESPDIPRISLLFHYPLIDSVQCDKPLFLISVVPAVQFVRRNPPFSGQVIDFELLVRGIPPSAGQISVGASAHLCRIPTAGMAWNLLTA